MCRYTQTRGWQIIIQKGEKVNYLSLYWTVCLTDYCFANHSSCFARPFSFGCTAMHPNDLHGVARNNSIRARSFWASSDSIINLAEAEKLKSASRLVGWLAVPVCSKLRLHVTLRQKFCQLTAAGTDLAKWKVRPLCARALYLWTCWLRSVARSKVRVWLSWAGWGSIYRHPFTSNPDRQPQINIRVVRRRPLGLFFARYLSNQV